MINHPEHYNQGGIETIDALRAALGMEGFMSFCLGNVIKYVWRAGYKPGHEVEEDLKKAQWYLNRAIAELEKASKETDSP